MKHETLIEAEIQKSHFDRPRGPLNYAKIVIGQNRTGFLHGVVFTNKNEYMRA